MGSHMSIETGSQSDSLEGNQSGEIMKPGSDSL